MFKTVQSAKIAIISSSTGKRSSKASLSSVYSWDLQVNCRFSPPISTGGAIGFRYVYVLICENVIVSS